MTDEEFPETRDDSASDALTRARGAFWKAAFPGAFSKASSVLLSYSAVESGLRAAIASSSLTLRDDDIGQPPTIHVSEETWTQRVQRLFGNIAATTWLDPKYSEEQNRTLMISDAQFKADKEMLDESHLMLRTLLRRLPP